MEFHDAAPSNFGPSIFPSSTFGLSSFSLPALPSSLSSSSTSLGSKSYRSEDLYVQSLSCNHANDAKSGDGSVSYLRVSGGYRPTKLDLATTPSKWRHSKALRRVFGRRCVLCSIIAQGVISFLELLSIENRRLFCQRGTSTIKIIYSAETGVLFTTPISTTHALSFSLFATETGPPIRKCALMPPVLDLEYVVSTAMNWIQECESSHPDCKVHKYPVLPTRVLDVGAANTDEDIKVVLGHGFVAQYIALSHFCENPNATIEMTKMSLPNLIRGIPWSSFPKTFQDAIMLTRAFGIRYLWIDTLCILQDDDEDWERESAKMARIYSDSFLTLAATASSDPSTGLFVERWTRCGLGSSLPHTFRKKDWKDKRVSIEGKKVPVKHQHGVYIRPKLHLAHERFRIEYNTDDFLEDAPLLSRAWAFQERLLPARTLHFHSEELVWECRSGLRCECNELQHYGFNQPATFQGLKQLLTVASKPYSSVEVLSYVWLKIVSEYSRLHLNKESDRLPALSGLASSLSSTTLGSYLAGVWSNDLARGLLFERATPAKRKDDQVHCVPLELIDLYQSNGETKPLEANVADLTTDDQCLSPSWSWSSIALGSSNHISYGSVIRNRVYQDFDFSIVQAQCTPVGNNAFSWVAASMLKVKGRISEGVVQPSPPSPKNTLRLIRNSQNSFGSGFSLASFKNDGRISFQGGEILTCLLVGRCSSPDGEGKILRDYALVLQEVCATRKQYRRVGLLIIEFSDQWFSESGIVTLELV